MTPLHHIGNVVRDLLLHVPLWAARGLFIATFVVLLIWVLLLPREAVTPDGPRRWDANLRYVAAAAILLQIVIYLLL